MNIITGNILDITEGIIAHQVNCKGVAGAGLAKQIRLKYKYWYQRYKDHVHKMALGDVGFCSVSSELLICDLYAQDGYGTDKQYTDYEALKRGLTVVGILARRLHLQVYLPYGLGAGYGGGNWAVISKIIDEVLPEAIVVRLG